MSYKEYNLINRIMEDVNRVVPQDRDQFATQNMQTAQESAQNDVAIASTSGRQLKIYSTTNIFKIV